MATITFVGPNPSAPETMGTKIVTVPDELFVQAVTALCSRHGYVPSEEEGPGQFAIQKTVDYWVAEIKAWGSDQAQVAASSVINAVMEPIHEDISAIGIADG